MGPPGTAGCSQGQGQAPGPRCGALVPSVPSPPGSWPRASPPGTRSDMSFPEDTVCNAQGVCDNLFSIWSFVSVKQNQRQPRQNLRAAKTAGDTGGPYEDPRGIRLAVHSAIRPAHSVTGLSQPTSLLNARLFLPQFTLLGARGGGPRAGLAEHWAWCEGATRISGAGTPQADGRKGILEWPQMPADARRCPGPQAEASALCVSAPCSAQS